MMIKMKCDIIKTFSETEMDFISQNLESKRKHSIDIQLNSKSAKWFNGIFFTKKNKGEDFISLRFVWYVSLKFSSSPILFLCAISCVYTVHTIPAYVIYLFYFLISCYVHSFDFHIPFDYITQFIYMNENRIKTKYINISMLGTEFFISEPIWMLTFSDWLWSGILSFVLSYFFFFFSPLIIQT